MEKKDIKKVEEIYLAENAKSLITLESISLEFADNQRVSDEMMSDERLHNNFLESYKYISHLAVLDEKYAEKLLRGIVATAFMGSYVTDRLMTSAIYNAHKMSDMSILKNALYTRNRLELGSNLQLCNGYNHSGNFLSVIYAFADCDIDLITKYLPVELGLSDKQTVPFFRASCNLIMSLVYNRVDWLPESIKQCEKFVGQKTSAKYDVLVVRYLLALHQRDVVAASSLLQEIALGYRKISWLFSYTLETLKYFGVYIHGLYNIGHYVLSEAQFEQLEVPEHSVFWKEFNNYTQMINYVKGSPVLTFEGDMAGVKKLFEDGWP